MKLQNCECISSVKELVVNGSTLVVRSISNIDEKLEGKTVIMRDFNDFYIGTIYKVDMGDPRLPFSISYQSDEKIVDHMWCKAKHVYVPVDDSKSIEDLLPEYFI